MKIVIETIPHKDQRYRTVGDWWFENEYPQENPKGGELITPKAFPTLHIRVSELSDWRREMLIAVHELVEVILCKQQGISQQAVDDFDMNFEANRKPYDDSEPGDSPDAPYCQEHSFATGIERLMASALDVTWADYEAELNKLP